MEATDPALQALIERVHLARARKTPLDIRGGGSKAFYGEPPSGEPLDVTPLSGISSYEPTELVVTVRAGTPLADLEAALAEQGQHLPFEPPRFAVSGVDGGAGGGRNQALMPLAGAVGGVNQLSMPPTGAVGGVNQLSMPPTGAVGGMNQLSMPPTGTVGGMVAAGLAGPARAAVGGVRDYVLGATLLNGRAEVLSFGGQVMKNVAGYDVSRLLAGSLGLLGVICEVSLKVLPVAPATVTLRFDFDEAQAISKLNEWGGQPLPLNASAWWEGSLVLRLSGAVAAVHAAQARLGGEAVEPALARAFWRGLRDHQDEYFVGASKAVAAGASLWRLSVPATTPPLKLSGEQLVEWGGAQRWLCTSTPAAALREAAALVGGHATLFRAPGRAINMFAPLKPPLARIHRELKAAFDPDGVFNRGRLYPGL